MSNHIRVSSSIVLALAGIVSCGDSESAPDRGEPAGQWGAAAGGCGGESNGCEAGSAGGSAGSPGSGGAGESGAGGASPGCGPMVGSASTGTTYYVATTGDDSYSCAEATDIATPKRNLMGPDGGIACMQTPGDALLLREGTYEAISNQTQDFPAGTSWDEAFTVAAYPGETVTLPGMTFGDCCDNPPLPQMSYWIFDGLHLVSTDPGNNALIYTGAHVDHLRFIHMEVTNNNASNGDPSPTDWSNSAGNTTGNCIAGAGSYLEFIDIEIHHCGAYGVYYTGQDTLFDRIEMHDVHGYGFHLYHSDLADVHRNTVRNSEFYNIIPVTPAGTYPGLAILLARGEGNAAYNNVVRDSGGGVASGNGAWGSKIYNNTVYNTDVGIRVGGASDVVVANNISWGNRVDIDDCGAECGATGNVFESNICSTDAHDYGAVACTLVDPRFADAAASDFHLLPCSPAIDAGLPFDEVTTDYDCVARPQGVAHDIGAYEFVGTPGPCGR
jgi:hypothetical protein